MGDTMGYMTLIDLLIYIIPLRAALFSNSSQSVVFRTLEACFSLLFRTVSPVVPPPETTGRCC